MAGFQVINFKSSNDNDYAFSAQEYSPDQIEDKIPAEFNQTEADRRDYARLYSFMEKAKVNFEADFKPIAKRLYTGEDESEPEGNDKREDKEKSKLCMMIEHMKPSGLSFVVANGIININPSADLSEAQYKDLARFCDLNNIGGISFPDNIDEKFKTEFMDVYANNSAQGVLGYSPENMTSSLNQQVRQNAFEQEGIETQAQNLPLEQQEEYIAEEQKKLADAKAKEDKAKEEIRPDMKKIKDNMKTFMSPRSGKAKDSTYFQNNSWDGWVEYRMYAKPEDQKTDGVYDSKAHTFKPNYEFDVRFKIIDGVMNMQYGTPGNKDIEPNYADEMVSMMKAQGFMTIEFSALTDKDKGKWRDACAGFGVLPSFNLGEKQARGMLSKAADNKISNLSVYKLRMAKKLRKQVASGDKDMTDDNNKGIRAVVIECEAENGVVPDGMKFKEDDIEKMTKIIRDNLTKNEQMEFKEKLAGQLEKQMNAENSNNENNPLFNMVVDLKNEAKFMPFKNVYVNHIQKHLKSVVAGEKGVAPDAVKVIGAADAATELFSIYEDCADMSMQEFMNTDKLNLDREKKEFLTQSGLDKQDLSKIKLRDLGEKNLLVMYKVMIAEREKYAKERIEKGLKTNAKDAVKDEVSAAYGGLSNIADGLSGAGFDRIRTFKLGNPSYNPGVATQFQRSGGRL